MPLTTTSDKHLILENVIVVWDGITRPEALEPKNGQPGGMKWNVKVVFPANHPDVHMLEQLGLRELHESEFKGVLPRGGSMPMGDVGPTEFNGMFTGYKVINASTFRTPDVRNEHGAQLQPHEYGSMIFNGQALDLIIHCAAYNNVSKGVATRLDGIRILTSRNAERLNIGGGGFNVSNVWGGGDAQPQQPQQQWQQPQGNAQPQQPQQQWQQPQGNAQPQQQPQQPQQWQQPQGNAQPQQPQQPQQWQQPQGNAQPPQSNGSPAPQQNNSWMPQQ